MAGFRLPAPASAVTPNASAASTAKQAACAARRLISVSGGAVLGAALDRAQHPIDDEHVAVRADHGGLVDPSLARREDGAGLELDARPLLGEEVDAEDHRVL